MAVMWVVGKEKSKAAHSAVRSAVCLVASMDALMAASMAVM